MSFEIIGFDREATFRFTAMLHAASELGEPKFGLIPSPLMIGEKIVCVRCQDFGAVFKPDEVFKLAKVVNKTQSAPPEMRKFTEQLKGCAEDARFANETANKAMI